MMVVLTGDGIHGSASSVIIRESGETPKEVVLSVTEAVDIPDAVAREMIANHTDVIEYKKSDHQKVLKDLGDKAKAANAETEEAAPKPRKGASYPTRRDVGPATKEG